MDNLNIDENTINQLKDMLNKGELSDIVSQIPPEMMQNFASTVSGNSNNNNGNNNTTNGSSSNFDFNNIDMNTILKLQSAMSMMNKKDDPRSNLLYSLKPYLRNEKKEKVDKYANLMNLTKIMDLLKNPTNNEKDVNDLKGE